MILFAGIPSEPPMQMAIEAAERLGLPHLILNQRHSAGIDLAMKWTDVALDGALWIGGERHSFDTIGGVYARIVEPTVLPELQPRRGQAPETSAIARTEAVTDLLNQWLDVRDGLVVNRPSCTGGNLSKPYQGQLIRAAGLLTPETLVSNEPEAVRQFHAEQGRIIYKSTSGIRSIVREWTIRSGPDLAMVRHVPTQFQAFVPGTNVRVHVVGAALFATAIQSGGIDYRYAERDGHTTTMRATELPSDVADACLRLARRLELPLAGIDLKRTPDGRWYCFEVNPSPAYSYFEQLGGQPIAEALVRLLAGCS